MSNNTVELRASKRFLVGSMKDLVKKAEAENRDMSPGELQEFDDLSSRVDAIDKRLTALEAIEQDEDTEDPAATAEGYNSRRSHRRSAPIGSRPGASGGASFSIGAAVRGIIETGRLPDRENEVSIRTARSMGKSVSPLSFYVPWNAKGERRDLTTSTGSGGLSTVTQPEIIELLRNQLIVDKLGATVYSGLNGVVKIPRQNGAVTASFVSEGSSVSASNATLDSVVLSPRMLMAQMIYTRHFLAESGINVEKFVENDLLATMARALDNAVFNGPGSGSNPTGLLQNSLPTVSSGTNGGPLTWANLNQLEETIREANGIVNPDKMTFVTSPLGARYAKTVTRAGSTYPVFLYDPQAGNLNGFPVVQSNFIPTNLTKGSGTGLTAMILGDWSQIIVGTWLSGFEVIVDPYTHASSGSIAVTAILMCDTNVMHLGSYAALVDVSA